MKYIHNFQNSNKRNNTIDFLRTILMIFIIAIHTLNSKGYEQYIIAFSRIAVPCFFIISGYLIANKHRTKILKAIKETFSLLIFSNIIHLFWSFFINYHGIRENFFNMPLNLIKSLIKFVLFNDSIFRGHLWFISALLYAHIINYFFISKFKKITTKSKITLLTFLLTITILLSELSPICLNKKINIIFYRNFLFFGLPYYYIGMILKNMNIKQNNYKYIISACIFSTLYFIELLLLKNIHSTINLEHYILTPFLSTNITILTLSYSNILKPTNIIALIGQNLSLDVYIFHVIIIDILKKIFKIFNIKINSISLFFLTIINSIIFSYILYIFKKKFSNYKNKKSNT